MSSAQLDLPPAAETLRPDSPAALRLQVAERLAAHRSRRSRHSAPLQVAERQEEPKHTTPHAASVAAAVAARYAQSTSYRTFLAQEAQRAVEQAAAAAEVAARNAAAVAAAQQQLLEELEAAAQAQEAAEQNERVTASANPVRQLSTAGLTVRLYEDAGRTPKPLVPVFHGPFRDNAVVAQTPQDDLEEALALDEEIAFRQSPVFEVTVPPEPLVPIPANLLEFPRQLVATKKARPRLAEGPLLDEEAARALYTSFQAPPMSPQLRIFEVAAEQAAPAELPPVVPEWTSLWLDTPGTAPVAFDTRAEQEYERAASPHIDLLPSLLPPQTAPLSQRIMAATVDAALVVGGLLAFTTAFAFATGPAVEMPHGSPAAIAATAAVATLHVLYHLLFFTFSDSTPGMRYARIGLCTFTDENPTRKAMRRRILASLIAASPLGLGLLWALLDEHHLGWHDRLSRMYQRSY